MLKAQDDIGRNNWVTSVKMMLFRYGVGFVWLSQDVGDINIFVRLFKQRLHDCFMQNLCENINSSTRCEMYKNIKSLLAPE